ncbi:hypothetical protein Ancab_034464 [Ancistrocladus abbreviatus]
MSSLPDSSDHLAPDSQSDSTRPFDDESYVAYDSQRFDSFSNFADSESVKESLDDSQIPNNFENGNGIFASEFPIDASGDSFSNGDQVNGVFVESDGPVLPPPSEMQEEGLALREWRRQNAILLEQKEKREKELLKQIIEEANEYKVAFSEKRKVTCESNKNSNREKERLFLVNHEKFHKEADKNYWKSIAELIPSEVPVLEKKGGKKNEQKKPSIIVLQGPKPGKPSDLSRMRHILLKLKHETPQHLTLIPSSSTASSDAVKAGTAAAATTVNAAAIETSSEAVVAA